MEILKESKTQFPGILRRLRFIARCFPKKVLKTGENIHFWFRDRPPPSSTILLVGSGRSGTTWLADVVAASTRIQQIFEPLSPIWNNEVRNLTGWQLGKMSTWYLSANQEYPEWADFLERVLTGRVRSCWTDTSITNLFPNRFLVKLIRANLMLGYIADHFRPKIVYIQRHPCAVISSRLKAGGTPDLKLLFRQELLVRDYIGPWLGEMEKEKDLIGAHAIWWAVENMVATRELAHRDHYAIHYETLCLDPNRHAGDLFSWLELLPPKDLAKIIYNPSAQGKGRSFSPSAVMTRLSSWEKKLSMEQQQRILRWAHKLGVTTYDENPLPG